VFAIKRLSAGAPVKPRYSDNAQPQDKRMKCEFGKHDDSETQSRARREMMSCRPCRRTADGDMSTRQTAGNSVSATSDRQTLQPPRCRSRPALRPTRPSGVTNASTVPQPVNARCRCRPRQVLPERPPVLACATQRRHNDVEARNISAAGNMRGMRGRSHMFCRKATDSEGR